MQGMHGTVVWLRLVTSLAMDSVRSAVLLAGFALSRVCHALRILTASEAPLLEFPGWRSVQQILHDQHRHPRYHCVDDLLVP